MEWNLKDLYESIDSKKIKNDFNKLEKNSLSFAKKYQSKINDNVSPNIIYSALIDLEKIYEGLGKISSYASLLFASDTNNEKVSQFYQSTSEKVSLIRKNLIFFFLDWNKIKNSTAKLIYSSEKLKKYRNLLESERKYKPYVLSEAEEKILDQKSLTSSRAFNRLFDQTLNNIIFDIKIDKKQKKMSETQILSLLYDKKRSTRARAAKSLTDGLNSEKRLITFIFNQILSDCKIINELRGYKNPIDSRNLSNEIKLQTVNGLIQACNDNNSIAQRYYKLKAKILKINDFKDYDRYAPFGSSQKILFC